MPGFGDIERRFTWGWIGFCGRKAGGKRTAIASPKLADEMVARAEMTTEEAKQFVEDLMALIQYFALTEPRRIFLKMKTLLAHSLRVEVRDQVICRKNCDSSSGISRSTNLLPGQEFVQLWKKILMVKQ